MMVRVLLMVAIAAMFAATSARAERLVGQASVIDGDTLEIHGQRIRISGIDAPESTQLCGDADGRNYRCGTEAANSLAKFIDDRIVGCSQIDRDRYNRVVAICDVDGVELGSWLVQQGHALDWPRYSKGRHAEAQREAEWAKRGLWLGSHVEPWLFRSCVRSGRRPTECSDAAQ
ncbi:thermonuclease family protein [Bradyrhizobium sp. sGM-13]|uniref:thermonuclease family protein n=1 Tax=Bradyrhizobium sp. sGM-13 TaxID=2831781 RepID=UPI0028112F04|nr:thermonuclease family protein [Bradyrhizobium sp. sGM-13]